MTLRPVPLCVLGLGMMVVAGCSALPTKGVLTGWAEPCSGPEPLPTANVWVFEDRKLVDHVQIPSGRTYRFVLPPGRYEVTNAGGSGGSPNAPVVVGHTTHVDLPDACE